MTNDGATHPRLVHWHHQQQLIFLKVITYTSQMHVRKQQLHQISQQRNQAQKQQHQRMHQQKQQRLKQMRKHTQIHVKLQLHQHMKHMQTKQK